MDQETLWREFSALPAEARQQVLNLIAALTAHQQPESGAAKPDTSLVDDPFVGMWRDRQNIAESSAWVRSVRKREWAPPGG
jgi:hypothetical protein